MTPEQVEALPHGLYRLYWKGGGYSVASVGSLHNGDRWFACANWTSSSIRGIASTQWEQVERAERVHLGGPHK